MNELEPNRPKNNDQTNETKEPKSLFGLGKIVGTRGALDALLKADQNPTDYCLVM